MKEAMVKCTGCKLMLPESAVCDFMEPDTCYRVFEEDTPKELNFSERERSNPYDEADHSDLIVFNPSELDEVDGDYDEI